MTKKSKQTELYYYGLYLLNHLRENLFPQATYADFIRERADHAAEVYEQARRSDLFSEAAAQELAIFENRQQTHDVHCLKFYKLLFDKIAFDEFNII